MLVMPYLFRSQRSGGRTPQSGSADKPVMGAFCAGSYEVTPPGRLRATTSSTRPTDRPKDSNPCVRLTESQTRRKTSAISSLAYGTYGGWIPCLLPARRNSWPHLTYSTGRRVIWLWHPRPPRPRGTSACPRTAGNARSCRHERSGRVRLCLPPAFRNRCVANDRRDRVAGLEEFLGRT